MSQAEFAAAFELHRNTLSRYETGIQLPDSGLLIALSTERNVSPSWLLLGIGEKEIQWDHFMNDCSAEVREEVLAGLAEAITHAAEKSLRYLGKQLSSETRERAHQSAIQYCRRLDAEGHPLNIQASVAAIVEGIAREI